MTAPEEQAVPVCTAAGCGLPQAAGALLCALDGRRLGDWLAQLGDEYARLTAEPSMQGREVGTIGGSTLASQRSNMRLEVAVLRDRRSRERDQEDPDGNNGRGVLEVLAARAAEVREGRQLVSAERRLPPVRVTLGGVGPVCDWWCAHDTCRAWTMRAVAPVPRTVASERRLLATHLDWILGQDWAGEFFDEMRALWGLLRGSNGHGAPTRRVHRLQAPCPSCGVRAVTHRPGDSEVCCENCGTTHAVDREKISA